jgi:hypothetical protein
MLKYFFRAATSRKPRIFEKLPLKAESPLSQAACAFVTGVGRSGTHFMATLFSETPGVSAFHMDDIGDAIGDGFTWYCKWYDLPVNNTGFLQSRSYLIDQAEEKGRLYLESNPMIAFSVEDLKIFNSKFVFVVRHPKKVVESHFRKGWYKNVSIGSGPGIPGYQYNHDRPNHFFSRIQPAEDNAFREWITLTQLGKIAWMWRATYERLFNQLGSLDSTRYRWIYLDRFSFEEYIEIADFLNILKPLKAGGFQKIRDAKPGKSALQGAIPWDTVSKEAYNKEVGSILDKFHFLPDKTEWLF